MDCSISCYALDTIYFITRIFLHRFDCDNVIINTVVVVVIVVVAAAAAASAMNTANDTSTSRNFTTFVKNSKFFNCNMYINQQDAQNSCD